MKAKIWSIIVLWALAYLLICFTLNSWDIMSNTSNADRFIIGINLIIISGLFFVDRLMDMGK